MILRKYFEILKRRKWILLASCISIPTIALVLMFIVKPVYKSKATAWIKLDTIQQKFIKDMPDEMGKLEFTDKDNAIGSVEGLIESAPVAGKVISELLLKDSAGALLNFSEFVNPGTIKLILKKKGVRIEHVTDSDSFEITGYSSDPLEARNIPDAVLNNLFEAYSEIYKKEAASAVKHIEERLRETRERLANAEKELSDFMERDHLYNSSTQVSTLISEISALETELDNTDRLIKSGKEDIRAIKGTLDTQPEFKLGQSTINVNPILDEYKKQLLTLELSIAQLKVNKTAEHPEVKSAMSQIEAVKGLISMEVEKTLGYQMTDRNTYYDSLVSSYGDAYIKLAKNNEIKSVLLEQIINKKRILKAIPDKEKRKSRLSREVENLNTLYTSLFSGLEIAKSGLKMDLSNIVVVQPPALASDVRDNLFFPPKKKVAPIVVSLFLGVFFGVFLVFLFEHFDESIWNTEGAELLGAKVIGVIPYANQAPLPYRSGSSSFSESIDDLLINLKHFNGGKQGKVFSVTSPALEDGKTSIAAYMAAALTRQGKKTLFIDGNLKSRRVNRIFEVSEGIESLKAYFTGEITADKAISRTSLNGLDIVVAGPLTANTYNFDSEMFLEMIKGYAAKYDAVIIETPPFESGRAVLSMSSAADNVIVVIKQGITPGWLARDLIKSLEMANIRVDGLVLNRFRS